MMTSIFESPFERLRILLQDTAPPREMTPHVLTLGELQTPPPTPLLASLGRLENWGRYPRLGGSSEMRRAYTSWLERRLGVSLSPDLDKAEVEPTPGSKQAAFAFIQLAVRSARAKGNLSPRVILPNPFYPAYLFGSVFEGAKLHFYSDAGRELPSLIKTLLIQDGLEPAVVVLCSPSNPSGSCLDDAQLKAIRCRLRLLSTLLLVDECYLDFYLDGPGLSALQALGRGSGGSPGLVVLHSLSKRSGVPGLRSGFAAGDPQWVRRYAAFNRSGGVSPPLPVCEAAAALWSDDAHVDENRDMVRRNWTIAEGRLSGYPGFRKPRAGFFIWLPVADDEQTAVRLWRDLAVQVLPGSYLAVQPKPGARNPGAGFIRIALVHPPAKTKVVLTMVAEQLAREASVILNSTVE